MKGIHTEATFEALIEAHLLEHGGYERGDPAAYDRDRALIPDLVVAFIEATQPKAWAKLAGIHKGKLKATLLDEVCKAMDKRGALTVLRHGVKFYGQKIRLAYFQPGNNLNPAIWELYAKNRLTVVRQLPYDPGNQNTLDLALFLNGLPIATVELKSPTSGQRVGHAIRQYKEDRDPKAPIFGFKKRALVHFAVDTDEAWMTTRLRGVKTFFLPFNKGYCNGKGNPPAEGKHRTHYLWEEVWQRDSLLDLVGRFVHLQVEEKEDPNTGKKSKSETMIFPRYHQLDCVRKLVGASRVEGAGTNYLVQHSAGSGKSNSIAWLAHRLASLHDEEDRKVYDSVVVLTDRKVLDQQLQNTIYQFEHKTGVVERIDKHSDQLAQALTSGAPIIISTIHKFGFIQDKMEALPDRRYAIIVDEAHSSQSGEMAVTVKELLSDSSVVAKLEAELAGEEDTPTADQLALRAALFRGPQPNMSFFGFTATPKHKTLELFGHKDAHDKPIPFHLYSMRQAIEEKFILDVLAGYITYKRFFRLAKSVADDPDVDKRKAASALARFVNLHPSNISQKTEIIIEHFRRCVMHQLGGRAKAMVVTGSRLQAVRYKQAFDTYIAAKGYADIRCLVAFSGEVSDDQVPGVTYTEPGMNKGIKETELPRRFASDAYQVLIVANKYQTGFDQPLLMAMYVDKRLAGVQAVQTLSRLNRRHRGKEQVFVLDFVNDRDHILAAFQDYYETTTTAETVDPQRLYELHHELEEFQVWTASEVDGFAGVFFKLKANQKLTDNARLNAWLDPAVDRFKALADDGEEGIERQEDLRAKLSAFRNLYSFLGQIIPFHDAELEKLYAYGRMLLRKLPRPEDAGPLDLGDDVALESLKLKREAEGKLELEKGGLGMLPGPTATGTGAGKGPLEKLSTIIERLNERFGTNFDVQDLVDGVADQLTASEELRQAAQVNDKGNFAHVLTPALDDALVDRHAKHGDFINKVFDDEAVGAFFREMMLDVVYRRLRQPAEVGTAGKRAAVLRFHPIPIEPTNPYVDCVPLLDLKVAAGSLSAGQVVDEDPARHDWVALAGSTRPAPGLFVAQVVGESMSRRIPSGAWCVWRAHPTGPRQGKVVLAQHGDIQDPDLGHYTVKVYESEKVATGEGGTRRVRIRLRPDSLEPGFEALVFEEGLQGELRIVAELVEVLG